MDVSVVIPTRGRRAAFLNQAIRSVWGQELRPRELIVAVDGDEEDCERVRRDVAAAELAVHAFVSTGRPVGVSATRNFGAETAGASVLAFLDDDDLWTPGHLAAFSGCTFDVGLSAFLKLRDDGTLIPEKTPPARLHPRRFLVANPGMRGSNLVVRRDLFRSIGGFRPSLPALNDLDLGIRLAEVPALRYRRIRDRLVIFSAHRQDRLTTAESDAIRVGVREFWKLHGERMDAEERQRFVARAWSLWRINVQEGS